jgi:hypothetical protein
MSLSKLLPHWEHEGSTMPSAASAGSAPCAVTAVQLRIRSAEQRLELAIFSPTASAGAATTWRHADWSHAAHTPAGHRCH